MGLYDPLRENDFFGKVYASDALPFDCGPNTYSTYDARPDGYDIYETACQTSSTAPVRVWRADGSTYTIPAGQQAQTYWQTMGSDYPNRCLYRKTVLTGFGFDCQCHECHGYWVP